MLEKIKAVFTGSVPFGLSDVFQDLRQKKPAAADALLAYIGAGKKPELLMTLGADVPSAIEQHCTNPWCTGSRKLEPLAANPRRLSNEQWVRLGQVFALAPKQAARAAKWPDAPGWFMAMQACRQQASQQKMVWEPAFLQSVLAAGGIPAGQVPPVIMTAFIGCLESGYRWDSRISVWQKDTPEIRSFVAFMATNIALAPAILAKANAATKSEAIVWFGLFPQLLPALTPMLAQWLAGSSKTVREGVVTLLPKLDEPLRSRTVAAALDQAVPATLGTVVDYAARSGTTGQILLQAALAEARGGKRDELLSAALQRSQVVARIPAAGVVIPPAPPLDTTPLGPGFTSALAAAVMRWAGTAEKSLAAGSHQGLEVWRNTRLARINALGLADYEAIRAWLNGTGARPRVVDDIPMQIMSGFNLSLLAAARYSIHVSQKRSLTFSTYELNQLVGVEYDLRNLAEALELAGVGKPLEKVARMIFTWGGLNGRNPEQIWPFFAEHSERLDKALGLVAEESASQRVSYEPDAMSLALRILAMFPTLPTKYVPLLAQLATAETKTHRREAQELLEQQPNVLAIAAHTLSNSKGEVRAAGAAWVGRIGDPAGVGPLREALAKEKREQPQAAILNALHLLGDDISAYLAPEVLAAAARKGLASKPPAGMEWFPLAGLPACRWTDGTPVAPEIIRWWALLAVKLKDPLGAGLIPLHISLLDKPSQEALGVFVLDTWIAYDTKIAGEEECRAYATANVDARYRRYQGWSGRFSAMTKEQIFDELRHEKLGQYAGSAIAEKGLLALTVGAPGHHVFSACQRYIRDHGRRRAQVEALITAASGNDDPAAIQLVLSVARKFKQETVRAKAQDLAERIAERTGWSLDELGDRTIPTAGFDDDGLLVLDYGPRSFTGRIARSGKTGAFTINIFNPDGKVISSLPKPGAADDETLAAEARKQLTVSKKELGQVVTLQTARLFEAMCLGRTWDVPSWREYLLNHPVMRHLVSTLVWQVGALGAYTSYRLFRPTPEGELLGIDDAAITLPENALVGLAHLATVGPAEAEQWRAHLRDYEIAPLFSQFESVAPPVSPDATAIDDHRGWFSDSFAIRGRATKRGYVRGAGEDGGWFNYYYKDLPGAGLRVVIEFTGSIVVEEKIPAAVEQLLFQRAERTLPLGDVPPILLAESYADYVYIAEAGAFDPEWEAKSGY